jgi:hypothetical protein
MFLHEAKCKREVCHCFRYTYPHRPGSRLCEQNPKSDFYLAEMCGEPPEVLLEILIDIAWNHKGKPPRSNECPF